MYIVRSFDLTDNKCLHSVHMYYVFFAQYYYRNISMKHSKVLIALVYIEYKPLRTLLTVVLL